jgi:hypothetical protein
MVAIGLTWLSVSTVIFVAVLVTVTSEQKKGQRLLLVRFRAWLDKLVFTAERRVLGAWEHFTKYIIQLGWYYSLHTFLRAILQTLVHFYEQLEQVFETNSRRARALRAEKHHATTSVDQHLTKMAEHKAATKLTPAQQRKLKEKQLKGD